jgi:sugar-specific transcriptional regulator TrmB
MGEPREAAGEAVPSIVPDHDRRSDLSLDEEEARVLGFVDGRSTADAIAALSGLPVARVRWVIGRLAARGVVELLAEPRRAENAS